MDKRAVMRLLVIIQLTQLVLTQPTTDSGEAACYSTDSHCSAQIQVLQTIVSSLQLQITNYRQTNNEMTEFVAKIERLEAKTDTLESANTNLQTKMDTLESANTNLQTKMDTLESENTNLQTKTNTLETENNNQDSEIADLKRARNTTQEHLETIEAEMLAHHPRDCADIYRSGQTTSGVYTIQLENEAVDVYCDMDTENGDGWTVFQRRLDDSVDFYRNWTMYQDGFGDMTGEYWWGLDHLAAITATRPYTLRLEMSDFEDATAWAEYSDFHVAPESDNYRLTISGYSGTAGNTLGGHNGQQFSTHDRDNDLHSSLNCAQYHHGAFWWRSCGRANPNGRYYSTPTVNYQGVGWFYWKSSFYSMKTMQMMFRPVDY